MSIDLAVDVPREVRVGLAPVGRPEGHELVTFDSFVPRRLVHRWTVAEVLLTDYVRPSEGRTLFGAQWSRNHRVYRPQAGVHDSLLVAETLRQAAIYLGHRELDLPEGTCFIMERVDFTADRAGMAEGAVAADVVLEAALVPTGRRTRTGAGFRVDVDFHRADRRVARGSGWVRCVAPAVYRRLRGEPGTGAPRVPAPVDPAGVGMCLPDDVVVGEPAGRAHPLRVLPAHPILFDHPLDHVPGMLVLEAARQAARLATGWPHGWVAASDLRLHHFLELDRPTEVTVVTETPAEPGESAVVCQVTQDGRTAAEANLVMVRPTRNVDSAKETV